ncbi:MAG: hypothetical protein CMJ64_19980 [Planctomycetaceae bacterium]|nr:hypothetical protein [Planctomycetaceae bacterium]
MQIPRMLAVAIPLMIATTTAAQDFRMETDVVVGKEPKPVAQNLTLFTGNLVYDFALGSADELAIREVTILNTQKSSIVLMDLTRKIRTEVSTDTLLRFTVRIRKIALEKRNGAVALDFQTQSDNKAKTVALTSERVTYIVSARETQQPDAVTRYREFADWYAQLNAMRPGNLPPFGRLQLNRELASRQWLPETITRTVVIDKLRRRRQELRSKHIVAWQLTNTDRRRINDAAGYQVGFQRVTLEDYLQPEKVAAR